MIGKCTNSANDSNYTTEKNCPVGNKCTENLKNISIIPSNFLMSMFVFNYNLL